MKGWVRLAVLGAGVHMALAQGTTPALTRHLEAAQAAQERQDCATAATEYAAAVRLLPASGELRTNYGIALYCSNRFAEAIRAMQQALHSTPDLVVPHLFLGLSYAHLSETASAIQELDIAVHRMPGDVTANLWLGYAYLAAHREQDAMARFNTVLAVQPGNVDARFAAGETLLQAGRAEARKLAQTAPGGRGIRLLVAQQQELAHAGAAAPDTASLPAWQPTEEQLFQQAWDDEKGARTALQTVLDEAPDSDRAHEIQGDAFSLQRKNEAAIAEYQAALQKNPSLPGIRLALVNCLMQTGHFEDALAVLAKEREIQPRSAEVWTSQGRVQLALGKDADALHSLQQALALPDHPPAALLLMGRAQLRLGNAAAAVPLLEQALHTGADPSTTNYLLARAYRTTGDRAAMARALEAYHRTSIDETERQATMAVTSDPKAVPDSLTAQDLHEATGTPAPETHPNR